MNLNLHIIADYLTDISFEKQVSSDLLSCNLTHLSFYLPELTPDEHTLYIIRKPALMALSGHHTALSFLCLGKPDINGLSPQDQFLFFDETIDCEYLLQKIQQIFLFFHQWETKMYDLLCHRASLMDLCEHCLCLTTNPFCLASSDMHILAYAEREGKEEGLKMFHDTDMGEYLTDEEIDAFRLDQNYLRGIESHTPCILNNDFYGFRHFYNNIFIDDIYIARIAICEVERPIRPGDYALLMKICDFFKIALENTDIVLNNHPKNFDRLVNRLLGEENVSDEEIDAVFAGTDWSHTGLYFCGIIESDLDRIMHSYQTLCSQLERFLDSSIAVALHDRIILIVNLAVSSLTKEAIRSHLSLFIRENLLRVGLSNCFRKFRDLPIFVHQAQDTLRMGQMKDSTIWCYDFDTYALQILLERAVRGHKPQAFCPEKLQILIEYDNKHNRNYVHTLKTYLQCNMSVAKTMRVLYVQRATLLYQLKRIEEISQINLQDYQTRLYLMIYFAIVD